MRPMAAPMGGGSAAQASVRAELSELGVGVVSTEPAELAAHARDCWPLLAMRERAGEQLVEPLAVVWPRSVSEAGRLYAWASGRGVPVVPYGGGGGVVGGAAPVAGCVAVDTKLLRRIVALDETSGLVTAEAGLIGQQLEDWLAARGWTLGHFPASIGVSSIGGFAAARSAGQASTRYGKFEDLVRGLEAVLPDGTPLRLRARPASAAGPDLAGLLLGAEGTLGLITAMDLRVHPAPAARRPYAYRLPTFSAGLAALREVLQRGLRPAVLRLSDAGETAASHADAVGEQGGCLLVTVCEGWEALAALEQSALAERVHAHGGDDLGEGPAREWVAHRYDTGHRLADVLEPGGVLGDAAAVDTCEVAAPWRELPAVHEALRAALAAHMDVVLCHASHCYPDGAALYFTFAAAGDGDEAAAQQRYADAWAAVMQAALGAGATISHHHGVGRLRARWLAEELGAGGRTLLGQVKAALDPAGIANPGKLGLDGATGDAADGGAR